MVGVEAKNVNEVIFKQSFILENIGMRSKRIDFFYKHFGKKEISLI